MKRTMAGQPESVFAQASNFVGNLACQIERYITNKSCQKNAACPDCILNLLANILLNKRRRFGHLGLVTPQIQEFRRKNQLSLFSQLKPIRLTILSCLQRSAVAFLRGS